jgi:hypothetical protein
MEEGGGERSHLWRWQTIPNRSVPRPVLVKNIFDKIK